MQEIIYQELVKMKENITNGDIVKLIIYINNFETFLNKNKDNFYNYLNWLKNQEEFVFSKDNFKKYYEEWLFIYQWKFENIYLYQEEDIAEIYESINYLLFLINEFKKNSDNYNIFFEILFELYNHILLIHINNLKNTLWK